MCLSVYSRCQVPLAPALDVDILVSTPEETVVSGDGYDDLDFGVRCRSLFLVCSLRIHHSL